mmetsp:Transcript_17821/g.49426  ORF Transcript_17821/g.49426 Transcript_17821/m.49426 type:complete len:246 (-) Transcript_17821:20-757(-)
MLTAMESGVIEHLEIWDKAIVLAHISEHAGRYDDMRQYMKERCEMGPALGTEERDLLSVAYKGSLDLRREAYRTSQLIEQERRQENDIKEADLAVNFIQRVSAEMQEICNECLDVVGKCLAKADAGEPRTFYLKLQADYNRYIAEFAEGSAKDVAIKKAKLYYAEAMKEADFHLLPTHPVKVGLCLNVAIFQHEVLEDIQLAIQTASEAHNAAMQSLEGMPEEAFRDAMPNVSLLADNLAMWRGE